MNMTLSFPKLEIIESDVAQLMQVLEDERASDFERTQAMESLERLLALLKDSRNQLSAES